MMNVVKGAVVSRPKRIWRGSQNTISLTSSYQLCNKNTLIVCWADSPAVMEMNHPSLTKEMAESWTRVFPEANVVVRATYDAVVV